ncbi:MAG: hypothetical protein IPP15_10420 [Saprospiraceae bacterium]|uniref:Uncharacterized protein n=1 Tax=Candidatus Opimibacter skivensis TaxID=2982028 RepID=A0A9D7STF0_9BACT|nr:hypothetical protein [Candidatus Opimibacter skivensis]
MEEEQIKLFIENKILESKVEAAEIRSQTMIWAAGFLLAVFGIAFPIFLAYDFRGDSKERIEYAISKMEIDFQDIKANEIKQQESFQKQITKFSTDQDQKNKEDLANIDNAIYNMQSQFKELAGTQLRKPILECFINGRPIEGAVVTLSANHANTVVEIRNAGDFPTRTIHVRIYTNSKNNGIVLGGGDNDWFPINVNDEPHYEKAFDATNIFSILDAKESQTVEFSMDVENSTDETIPVLLKVYYGQPEPQKFHFTIIINSK